MDNVRTSCCGLCRVAEKTTVNTGQPPVNGILSELLEGGNCQPVSVNVPCRRLVCDVCWDRLITLERSCCQCKELRRPTPPPPPPPPQLHKTSRKQLLNKLRSQTSSLSSPPISRSVCVEEAADGVTTKPSPQPGAGGDGGTYVVTHVSSPWLIHVRSRDVEAKSQLERSTLERQLEGFRFTGEKNKKYFDYRGGCASAVVIRRGSRAYRGKLMAADCTDNVAAVRLLDTGEDCKVAWQLVEPMPDSMTRVLAFCFPVALDGIVPAGSDQNEWSISAKEKLKEILRGREHFYLRSKNFPKFNDGTKTIAATLSYEDADCQDPFGLAQVKLHDVAEELVQVGLALRRRRSDCNATSSSSSPAEKEVTSSSSVCVEVESPSIKLDEAEADHQRRWVSPVLPNQRKFEVLITYIDVEAQIYGQPVQWQKRIRKMEDVLTEAHKDVSISPDDLFWIVGDACVAKYPDAGSWHRGVVTKVGDGDDEDVVTVLFVDYGETMKVFPSQNEVHKSLAAAAAAECLKLPIGCLRFKLDRILPIGGKYDERFLDEIHPLIVDKLAQVEIVGGLPAFPLASVIHVRDDKGDFSLNLSDIFRQKGASKLVRTKVPDCELNERLEAAGHHVQPEGRGSIESVMDVAAATPSSCKRRETTLDAVLPLLLMTHLKLDVEAAKDVMLPCQIVGSVKDDVLIVQLFPSGDQVLAAAIPDDLELRTKISENHQDFIKLTMLLNDGGENLMDDVDVQSLEVGDLCLAKYSEDGSWYRAEIRSFIKRDDGAESIVRVAYIDYGNAEVLPVSSLNAIPTTLMVLPRQAVALKVSRPFKFEDLLIGGQLAVKLLDPKEGMVELFRFTSENFEKF